MCRAPSLLSISIAHYHRNGFPNLDGNAFIIHTLFQSFFRKNTAHDYFTMAPWWMDQEEFSPRPQIKEMIGKMPPGIRFPLDPLEFRAVPTKPVFIHDYAFPSSGASSAIATPDSQQENLNQGISSPRVWRTLPSQFPPCNFTLCIRCLRKEKELWLIHMRTVSWNWGGSHPSGTAAEVKAGEVTVTSHRGNEISKTGTEENPAVHIERSGNDVVKTANELNVDKKAEGSTNGTSAKKDETKDEEKEDVDMNRGDQDEELKDAEEEKDDEKEEGDKKEEAQTGDKRKANEKADAAEEREDDDKNGDDTKDTKKQKTTNGTSNGEKKKPGRPKASTTNGDKKAAPKKEKKEPAVGKAQRKTRSQTKD